MRNLFLTLVLANLALAAWLAWFAGSRSGEPTPSETGIPIRLVSEGGRGGVEAAELAAAVAPLGASVSDPSETDAAATDVPPTEVSPTEALPTGASATAASPTGASAIATSPADASATDASATEAAACISIGPFADVASADAAAASLQAAAYAPARRSAEGEIWIGFWVHLGAISSREEADAMLARLREGGFPDAYPIPQDSGGYVISLGVLNTMARASRLEEQARSIGFAPVTLERSRPGMVQWLDVTLAGGRELDLAALGIRGDRLGQRPCSAAG